MLSIAFGDLRSAERALRAMPLTAAVIVLSLAVGVGANTVVFSWIQALVFRPLPGVADASAYHVVDPVTPSGTRPGASWLEYRDLAGRLRTFADLFAFRMVPLNVGEPATTERAYGLLVSGNYFSALGLQPAAGRFFRPEETSTAGREPVMVVSYDYWVAKLARAPDAIRRRLRLNGRELTVIGVAPDGFQGTILGLQMDLWVPATMAPLVLSGSRELEDRDVRGYSVMGALAPGTSLAQAQAEVSAAMEQLARERPESNASVEAEVLPFWRAARGPQRMLVQGLTVLQGVMLLLLLAVCGNSASLLLARVSRRTKEVGVRLALGASRWRVIRLLLVENLLLGAAGAALGALLAAWGTTALRAMPLFTTQFPVRFQTSLNGEGLLFATLLATAAAILLGAPAALHVTRTAPHVALRSAGGGSPAGSVGRALTAVEAALATVVLVAAALFFQNFRVSQGSDPGFRPDGVLLAAYDLTGKGVDVDGTRRFADRLLERLRTLPDVEAAAIATSIPLDIHGLPVRTFALEGRARSDSAPDRTLSNVVTPGYFDVMGIAFKAGSDFVPLSDRTAPPQAIVNEAFARRWVADGETLGRRVTMGETTYTIVGVVQTTTSDAFGEPPTPVVYLSYRDRPAGFGEIHVRTRLGDETVVASSVRRAVRDLDESLPVYNVRTLIAHVEMNVSLRKIPARMFLVLGPLLLALAAIGIYAIAAYSVASRTSEIGVRVALGATVPQLLTQFIGETLWVVAAGAAAGWALVAFLYMRFLGAALDPVAFTAAPLLLLAVAAMASWVPARRASRVDPVVALRTE